MHRRILLAMSASLLAGLVSAQEAGPPEAAIQSVIRNQIDAFRRDAMDEAFSFAGPGIQSMFRTPENFGAMVRNGYPMVWRPDSFRFGELNEIDGVLWQRLVITDSGGSTHVLDYRMGKYGGEWRVDGVQFVRAPDVSA